MSFWVGPNSIVKLNECMIQILKCLEAYQDSKSIKYNCLPSHKAASEIGFG